MRIANRLSLATLIIVTALAPRIVTGATALNFTLADPLLGGEYSLDLALQSSNATDDWLATITADFTAPNQSLLTDNPVITEFEFKGATAYNSVGMVGGTDGSPLPAIYGPLAATGCKGDLDDFICVQLGSPVSATGTPTYTWAVPFSVLSGEEVFAHHVGFRFTTDVKDKGLIVSLTNPIPEPNALVVFLAGSLIVGMAVRKRANA
jgi:hypothetical protein